MDYDCVLDFGEKFKYIPIDLEEMHEIIVNRFEHDITDKLRELMGGVIKRKIKKDL